MTGHDERDDAAFTELEADAWHQDDEGNYYVDCPECGSAATLSNVVQHGRCNGYLDQQEDETAVDEEAMSCTATLWFELGYTSDPDTGGIDDAVGANGDRGSDARGSDEPETDEPEMAHDDSSAEMN